MSEVSRIVWDKEKVKVDTLAFLLVFVGLALCCALIALLLDGLTTRSGGVDLFASVLMGGAWAVKLVKYPLCLFVGWRVGRSDYFRVES